MGRAVVSYKNIWYRYPTGSYSAICGRGLPRVRLIRLLAYDRWRMNGSQEHLDNLVVHVPITPFGQGFQDMSSATNKVDQFVAERKLCQCDKPILDMCVAGVIIQFAS